MNKSIYRNLIVSAFTLLFLSSSSLAWSLSYSEIREKCKQPAAVLYGMGGLLIDRHSKTVENYEQRMRSDLFDQPKPTRKEIIKATKFKEKLISIEKIILKSHLISCVNTKHKRYTVYKEAWFLDGNNGITVLDKVLDYKSTVQKFIDLAGEEMIKKVAIELNMPTFGENEIEKYSPLYENKQYRIRSVPPRAFVEPIHSLTDGYYDDSELYKYLDEITGSRIITNKALLETFHKWVSKKETQEKIKGSCDIHKSTDTRRICKWITSLSKDYLKLASRMSGIPKTSMEGVESIDELIGIRKSAIAAQREKSQKRKEAMRGQSALKNSVKQSNPQSGGELRSAKLLCQTIDDLGAQCGFDGATNQVVVVVKARESARDLCSGISSVALNEGIKFSHGWKLMVFKNHANSGDYARCSL